MKALPLAGLLLAGCATAPPLPPFPASHPGSQAAAAAPLPAASSALAMPAANGADAAKAPIPAAPGARRH